MPERARLRAIERYSLAEPLRDGAFDQLTRTAAELFHVPISLVTVITADRQLFRGACGIEGDGTARDVAFCTHAVEQPDVMVVEDAALDPRFRDNPLVTGEPHIRFYAGAPIRVEGDIAIGTLCLIDTEPRSFSREERRQLELMAGIVTNLIELRAGSLAAEARRVELERQAELLAATVENVEQGIAVFAPDLSLILWNRLFFDLFGFPLRYAKAGTSAATLIGIAAERGELGQGEPQQIVDALIGSVRNSPNRRLAVQRGDGRTLDIWRSTMADGRFILTATDVTEQRQLGRLKDEFVSTVSHELRTPLTSIIGSLSLLSGGIAGDLPERAKQLIRIAEQNGRRLNELINDLLDIEKLEKGEIEFDMSVIDVARLATDAVAQNRPYAEQFGVGLYLETRSAPLCVEGDEGRLLQALSNLISNGAKFSPRGETVTVTVERRGKAARVTVSDQGPGIPEAFRPRLFQRFAQADDGDRGGHPGTGLGLAITKNIIEKHRGTIGYRTELGFGTSFFFDLPLAGGEEKGMAGG